GRQLTQTVARAHGKIPSCVTVWHDLVRILRESPMPGSSCEFSSSSFPKFPGGWRSFLPIACRSSPQRRKRPVFCALAAFFRPSAFYLLVVSKGAPRIEPLTALAPAAAWRLGSVAESAARCRWLCL